MCLAIHFQELRSAASVSPLQKPRRNQRRLLYGFRASARATRYSVDNSLLVIQTSSQALHYLDLLTEACHGS